MRISIASRPAIRKNTAAETAARGKTLVVLFQRGAADGLNVVVPHGERAYYDLRPSIAIARPGRREGGAIDLDGFFGHGAGCLARPGHGAALP